MKKLKGGIERVVVSVIIIALVAVLCMTVIKMSQSGTELIGGTIGTTTGNMHGAAFTVE